MVYIPQISPDLWGFVRVFILFYIDLFTLAVIKPVLTVILEVS